MITQGEGVTIHDLKRRGLSVSAMASVDGDLDCVPDAARKRVLDLQNHPSEARIFEDGALIAAHPRLEGRNQRRVDPRPREAPPPAAADQPAPAGAPVRPLSLHDAVARRLAGDGAAR